MPREVFHREICRSGISESKLSVLKFPVGAVDCSMGLEWKPLFRLTKYS